MLTRAGGGAVSGGRGVRGPQKGSKKGGRLIKCKHSSAVATTVERASLKVCYEKIA